MLLTVELVFLSFSATDAVGGGKGRVIGTTAGAALVPPAGYLPLAEEQPTETHKVEAVPPTPVAFFLGFPAMIRLEEQL